MIICIENMYKIGQKDDNIECKGIGKRKKNNGRLF